MKQHRGTVLAILFILLVVSTAAGAIVVAQTSSAFNLEWHVLGSSGEATSAGYRVRGTLGQSLAAPPHAGSTNFDVSSGYWVFDDDMTLYMPFVAGN